MLALGAEPTWVQDTQSLLRQAATEMAVPGARIEVVVGELDPRLHLDPCQRIEAYLPTNVRPLGRTRVGLRCTQGAKAWNVYLPVTVKLWAAAWVLREPLAAGTVLNESHLQLSPVDWAADANLPTAQADELVGRTLLHGLAAAQAVRRTDLKSRVWFSAGDTVRVVANGAGFSVAAQAQALANGVEGQRVRVRTDAGQVLTGLPTGAYRVELSL